MSSNSKHTGPLAVLWKAAADLISPDPYLREQGLDLLSGDSSLADDPLAAYLLATRLADEDLEIRFHAVQILGDWLDFEKAQGKVLSDQALTQVHYYLSRMGTDQLVGLLEVAEHYLAAEQPILQILKTSSYAGQQLSGIVNDRKISAPTRSLAAYFGAEAGFLELIPVLRNLIQRIEKSRLKAERSLTGKQFQEEDALYISALAALDKLTAGSVRDV